jgi:hypothetical protein
LSRLRELRLKKGLRILDVTCATKVHSSTLSSIERGRLAVPTSAPIAAIESLSPLLPPHHHDQQPSAPGRASQDRLSAVAVEEPIAPI